MGRPSTHLRVTYLASTATLLLFAGHRAVYAQTGADASASTPALTGGLDRILVALGILLVLAQATERVVVILRKLLTRMGRDWAGPSAEEAPPGSREKADRSLVINAFLAVPAGLFVAVICGVDVIHLAVTGRVALIWQFGQWDGLQWPQHLFGLFLTGLIASMGSAFLHDLIAIVTAAKDARRKAAAAPPTTFPISPPPTEDLRKLLDDDHPSIYDIDRESLGLPLDELGPLAARVHDQLRARGIEDIVDVGATYKQRGERPTRVRGLTVSVVEKKGSPECLIPPFLETECAGRKVLIPLDVEEVGMPEPMRSLQPGMSIKSGPPDDREPGTLCCLVTFRHGSAQPLVLSCRHVMGDIDAEVNSNDGKSIGKVVSSSRTWDASICSVNIQNFSVANEPNRNLYNRHPDSILPLSDTLVRGGQIWVYGNEQGPNSERRGASLRLVSVSTRDGSIALSSALRADVEVTHGDSGALALFYREGVWSAVGMLSLATPLSNPVRGWFSPLRQIADIFSIDLLHRGET